MGKHDNDPHFVYVLRDADNEIHYVGCSYAPSSRWRQHHFSLKKDDNVLYRMMREKGVTFVGWRMKIISEWADRELGYHEENRLRNQLWQDGIDLWQGRPGRK